MYIILYVTFFLYMYYYVWQRYIYMCDEKLTIQDTSIWPDSVPIREVQLSLYMCVCIIPCFLLSTLSLPPSLPSLLPSLLISYLHKPTSNGGLKPTNDRLKRTTAGSIRSTPRNTTQASSSNNKGSTSYLWRRGMSTRRTVAGKTTVNSYRALYM